MPVAIPGREVHLIEVALGTQDLIDQAHALHELRPIEPGDQAHARDHVSNGHVHRGLPLVFQADGLLGADALDGQELLQPPQRRRHGRVLIAQPLEELDLPGSRQRQARKPAKRCGRRIGTLLAQAEQAVRELIRLLACDAAANDLVRQAAHVLDHQDSQADGDRPELAEGQRLDPLVGGHQAAQALGVESAVGVRDVRPRHAENSRIPFQRASCQLRQLAIVVGRQVVADLAQLLFDDMEVVDEPFSGRCDRSFVLDRLGQRPVGLEEHATVLCDPRPDGVSGARLPGDRLGGREGFAVLLQALDAEELGDDRVCRVHLAAHYPGILIDDFLALETPRRGVSRVR